ncbi:hypothetical protein [Parabacteroides sp. FAFU027]|uniref:hypothetical protein n=1 Tax=Parabacteroides sp. FAFU027 TaxID=2922715 RepID=UPI001FAFA485|nr:hypothetical protein [Parabacteroides sp. FAFU027]
MPKSRKRKFPKKNPKKRNPKPYEVVKQEFVQMENPFPADIPFEKRIEFLLEIGNKAKNDFESDYPKLIHFFKEYDSLYLCSFCAYYFSLNKEGIDEEAVNGYLDFAPFHLEILQCISLMFEQNLSAKPLHESIEEFKTTIKNLSQNHSFMSFLLVEKAETQEDISKMLLRTEMMNHTRAVRNWAFVQQMETTAYDLAELIEDRFVTSLGFSPKNFLDILFSLVSLTEEKINIHLRKTSSFCRMKKYNEVFDKYEKCFRHVKCTDDSTRKRLWDRYGKDIKTLKALLLQHSDLFLSDIFTHSSSEIHSHLSGEIPENEICNVLDKLSFKFGELSQINKDHIFLDNPVHSKPFINIDGDKYFSVITHMFSHLGVDLLEKFISNDNELKKEYALKKGKYLEAKVEQLFRQSFPDAQIFTGSLWKCPTENKEFENDLIVLIEDFAIIVECKSGTVSPPARRGATERLSGTLQKLIIEPSEQAIRFENYLKKHKQTHTFKTKSGAKNQIDSTKIEYYVPLGVTLSNLGSIGCNLKNLIDSKITSHKLSELAPSISLTDLEVIFEVLPLQAEKIHYLSRRREFEAHLNFRGDEIDLFGFYLDNGFNIGETEYDELFHIDLTLKSKALDPYFIGKHRGVNVKKPYLRKTKYWNDLLVTLEKNAKNWLHMSYILLNMPEEDQLKFEKTLKHLSDRVIKGKCIQRHNWLIMDCGPKRRKYAIVGYPYKDTDKETRNAIINDIVVSCDKENIRGIVILGYNLDSKNYPYSVVAGSLKTDFFDSLELKHQIE